MSRTKGSHNKPILDGFAPRSVTIIHRATVEAIVRQASLSGIGPTVWATQAIEEWIREHRTNRDRADPNRHDAREHDGTMY
jgi:hypothetical protein